MDFLSYGTLEHKDCVINFRRAKGGINYVCLKLFKSLPLKVKNLAQYHFKIEVKSYLLKKIFLPNSRFPQK